MKNLIILALGLATSIAAFAKIEIQNPWIKPSGGPNTSLFMRIINTADKPDKLIDVKDNQNYWVQFHEKKEDQDGKVTTIPVSYFGIPPKGNIMLQPGQNHVMLKNIKRPLKVGDNVQVSLQFANGETINLRVPVKETADGSIQPPSNSLMNP